MGRLRRLVPCWVLAATLLLAASGSAHAKEHGIHTPGGRDIYQDNETFAEAIALDARQFVVEIATGLAPEGMLAAQTGWLAPSLGGLEFYVGVGGQLDPARLYAASARYWLSIFGLKPFVGAGYVYQDHFRMGMRSQLVFAELGYKWRIYHTYHFTLGLGARVVADVRLLSGTTLDSSTIDPGLLDQQMDGLPRLMPTLSLRFSRAF